MTIKHSLRILNHCRQRKEFLRLEDGFYYYFPTSYGALTPDNLRVIADELDRLNQPMADELNRYFEAKGNQ